MESIKFLECVCGEEVHEDDIHPDTRKKNVLSCINCGKFYSKSDLKEVPLSYNIIQQGEIEAVEIPFLTEDK